MALQDMKKSRNQRLDFLTALCSDENGAIDCQEEEFVVHGTGQSINLKAYQQDIKDLSSNQDHHDDVWNGTTAAMACVSGCGVLAGAALLARRATKNLKAQPPKGNPKASSSSEQERAIESSSKEATMKKEGKNKNLSEKSCSCSSAEPVLIAENDPISQKQNIGISAIPAIPATEELTLDHGIVMDIDDCPMEGYAAFIRDDSSNGGLPDKIVSTQQADATPASLVPVLPNELSQCSDDVTSRASLVSALPNELSQVEQENLEQEGDDCAKKLASFMSGFQSRMKGSGYDLSNREALLIANQHLLSQEALKSQRATEARQLLYDFEQRNIDRSLSERQHSENLENQEKDKKWVERLQKARDECIQSIFPSIRTSCLIALGMLVSYRTYNIVSPVVRNCGLFSVECRNEILGTGVSWLMAYTSIALQSWHAVVHILCLACVGVLALTQYTTVFQIASTAVAAAVVVQTCNIPVMTLLGTQVLFGAVSFHITKDLFHQARHQLDVACGCPRIKDVDSHLLKLDETKDWLSYAAYCINGCIILCSIGLDFFKE